MGAIRRCADLDGTPGAQLFNAMHVATSSFLRMDLIWFFIWFSIWFFIWYLVSMIWWFWCDLFDFFIWCLIWYFFSLIWCVSFYLIDLVGLMDLIVCAVTHSHFWSLVTLIWCDFKISHYIVLFDWFGWFDGCDWFDWLRRNALAFIDDHATS